MREEKTLVKSLSVLTILFNQMVVIFFPVDYYNLVQQGGFIALYNGIRCNMEYRNFHLSTLRLFGWHLSPSGRDY